MMSTVSRSAFGTALLSLSLLLSLLGLGCSDSTSTPSADSKSASSETSSGGAGAESAVDTSSWPKVFVPTDERILLIVGQDLDSVRDYTASGCCPEPAGITTYLALYKLLNGDLQYGGIGIDADGAPLDELADWGAGQSSLYTVMQEYPNSAIAVGLSIGENEQPNAMQGLIGGAFDPEIRHLAELLKTHPHPVFLRVGYEFDGMWNTGYENRQQYIDAYRRVVDVTREVQADNVVFVWQASASPTDDSIEGAHEDITEWYPGDEYVDWMGLSWFLRPDYVGPKAATQVTQNQLADELVQFARARSKPVVIAESTPLAYDLTHKYKADHSPVWDGTPHQNKVEKTDLEIWDEWFAPYFAYIHANRDVIRAVAYINAHWDSQAMWSENDYASGFWGDSRLQQNPIILEKWLAETGQPTWVSTAQQLDPLPAVE